MFTRGKSTQKKFQGAKYETREEILQNTIKVSFLQYLFKLGNQSRYSDRATGRMLQGLNAGKG
jgi:hypothetical protein